VNVPAGLIDEVLPVGAQLLGPANSEPLLISLAAALEQSERWPERWPEVSVSTPSAAEI
jgi:amidase